MPGIDDWTLTPHRVIDKIFEECGPAGPWRENVKQYFEQEVAQQSILKKLPWLNETPLHQLRPSQVVRFRGMVQDMFDSEFFLDVYQVRDAGGNTRLQAGRYKDIAECGVGETILTESRECVTGDRLVYYCVPIPGESDWVKQIYQEMNPSAPEASTSSTTSRKKRPAGEESGGGGCGREEAASENMECMDTEAGSSDAKRTKGNPERLAATQGIAGGSAMTATPSLNFPLSDMTGTPCLIKTYGDEIFSLNDMVEVVGILSVDPALAPSPSGQNGGEVRGMEMEEEAAHSPPPSLVPRLHVLSARLMSHTYPLLPDTPPALLQPREGREELRKVLEEACLGDGLAAELLICHLLSSVYLRKDVIALGKYSVNLSGIQRPLQDQSYSSHLYSLLSRLVTQSHRLSVTLTTMNSTNFIPKKDYQANRLVSGLLQLPKHTHLVVDETCLTAGQLDSKGVHNLTALGNLINWQKVDYDFKFHNLEQHTNIPVLILSEGRSMISSDSEVRLEPRHTDVSGAFGRAEALLTPEVLTNIRTYLTTLRLSDYTLSEDMQKLVQDDFVDSRKSDNGITAEDLHHLLVLARLVALSCGESSLTQDVWKSAKILESERKLRLNRPATQ